MFPYLFIKIYYGWQRITHQKESENTDEWKEFRGKRIKINLQELKKFYEGSLKSFISVCRNFDIKPVLMTQAYDDSGSARNEEFPDTLTLHVDDPSSKRIIAGLQNEFNSIIRTVAAENNILCIDLAGKMKPENSYLYDEVHYTDIGSVKAGKIISAELDSLVRNTSGNK